MLCNAVRFAHLYLAQLADAISSVLRLRVLRGILRVFGGRGFSSRKIVTQSDAFRCTHISGTHYLKIE